jgi:hypothetical protein
MIRDNNHNHNLDDCSELSGKGRRDRNLRTIFRDPDRSSIIPRTTSEIRKKKSKSDSIQMSSPHGSEIGEDYSENSFHSTKSEKEQGIFEVYVCMKMIL